MGEQITGYDLHLPFQTFVVQGIVAYSDGKPASDIEVRLSQEQSANENIYQVDGLDTDIQTDGSGHFRLRGYKGVTYKILALDDLSRAIEEKRELARAETNKILVDRNIDDLKLVLPIKPRAMPPTEDKKSNPL